MKFKHPYLPKPGSLTRTGDEKYLENGTFLRRRVNEVKQVNPETETFSYRVSRIGLYESGLTSLTCLTLSTLGLGFPALRSEEIEHE